MIGKTRIKEELRMKIKPFGVESWMDLYETKCKYNIAETCVDSISLNEFEELISEPGYFSENLMGKRLTYGEIPGSIDFRKGVSSLFKDVNVENILSTNGAIGANFLALFTLVEPEDEVVSIIPTYQQHYSIPESLGASVKIVKLKKENRFVPDLDELRQTVTGKTKLICMNNPNNPSGALMSEEVITQIIEIAKEVDAYILCDEVYRHLNQEDVYAPSIVDLYEKGISTGSMSKVFSMAGLRLGWLVAPKEVIEKAYDMRHYNMISCGMLDEAIAAKVLENKDKILERNLKIVRDNIEIVDAWVQNEPRIDYIRPRAGSTALLYFDMDITSTELCHRMMAEEGIMLVPGDCFDMGKCLRIGYAFNPDELKEGLSALSRYLRQFD